ncbi:DNA-binding protein [Allochromatium humboldtianum]|uniref:DNA-binding protein n=1 Tax=Allochromatium humboldtianum TaxID=504901 RepID=A0A850RJJ2_9GAMM|nr:DNA-binding protein [Allochromatium humboldtianum]NVZ11272.1 DNA-binding protein [Allochromatium humboldtianum]
MSTHGDTRKAAFEAACELAASGERPTVVAVRAKLGGKGGQNAIQAGLNDWIEEAARRFQLPGLPESLQMAVIAFWDVACQTAKAQWDEERAALLTQLESRDQQLAERTQERDALENERDQIRAERDQRTQALAQAQGELFAAHQHTRALETERADLMQRLADAEASVAQLTETGAQLVAKVRDLEHSEQEWKETAKRLETERDQLQAEVEAAKQKIAQLEHLRTQEKRERAQLAAALDQSRGDLEAGRTALAEHAAQIKTLTDLLERTQATHEAESAHWLLQIDDQRQALSSARERERRWDQERATLLSEIRRLSAEFAPRPPLED